MKTTIFINNIERETEKAILVNLNVSYNDNTPKARTIWFPKSVIAICNCTASVESWFLKKLSNENAFHGYTMDFEEPIHTC